MRVKMPALGCDGLPKENGTTRRDANGGLLYLNPVTGQYEPAVRLEDIRDRLIQGNGQTYDIPKKHGNSHGLSPLNYTSFLAQDKSYGPSRDNRNHILFQLEPTTVGVEPTDYLRYEDKVVLDAYDHGIRDFGDAMPLCLSTELEGHDIETYKRRNSKMALYDLIARMPSSYASGKSGNTWQYKPPRSGNISMRATRFRIRAGCLTWHEKGDSEAKNTAIMDLMPANVRATCEKTNSTTPFRDLTKLEQHQCETATGKRPSKSKSKAKRAKQQVNDQENGHESIQDQSNTGRPTKHDIVAAVAKGRGSNKRRKRALSEVSTSEDGEVNQPPRKSQRGAGQAAVDSESEYEPGPRKRITLKLKSRKTTARSPSSRGDAESASAFGEDIANAHGKLQQAINIVDGEEEGKHNDLQPSYSEASESPHSALDYVPGAEDSLDTEPKGVLLNVEKGTQLPKRHSKKRKAVDGLEQSIQGETYGVESADAVSTAHKTPKKLRRRIAREGDTTTILDAATTARKEPKQGRLQDQKTVPAMDIKQLPSPEMQPLLAEESSLPGVPGAAGNDADLTGEQPFHRAPIIEAARVPPEDQDYVAPKAISESSHLSSEVDFDPNCEEFQSEVTAGIQAGDCRYMSPTSPEDVEAIARALELSIADFVEKTGHSISSSIVKHHAEEPYVSQQRRMDAVFENERLETGVHDGESLYFLPYWTGGFENWREVLDEEGMSLWSKMQS